MAGSEKGRERREVTRWRRRRRFLQDRGAVLWPSTSVEGRERLRLGLGSGCSRSGMGARGNVRMGLPVGCIWVKTHCEEVVGGCDA